MSTHDPVNHPAHYTSDPSGVEAIEICRVLPFALGNAVKYLWRAGQKGKELEDLQKALWYLNDYREQHGGVDDWPTDPTLSTLPWQRIAAWCLWQEPQNPRSVAIYRICCGKYSLACLGIEAQIEDLATTTANSDDHK